MAHFLQLLFIKIWDGVPLYSITVKIHSKLLSNSCQYITVNSIATFLQCTHYFFILLDEYSFFTRTDIITDMSVYQILFRNI